MATDVRDKADAAEQAMRRHAEERDRRVLRLLLCYAQA